MATLTISHHIYLDKNQRHTLHEGQSVEVTGVAVPVWFKKGNTTEPAPEIFCRYKLTNDRKGTMVIRTTTGFHINLPSLELLGELKKEKHEDGPEFDKLYEEVLKAYQKQYGTSEMLLDFEEGGMERSEFKYYNKVDIDNKLHYAVHFVEIKPIEILLDTLS